MAARKFAAQARSRLPLSATTARRESKAFLWVAASLLAAVGAVAAIRTHGAHVAPSSSPRPVGTDADLRASSIAPLPASSPEPRVVSWALPTPSSVPGIASPESAPPVPDAKTAREELLRRITSSGRARGGSSEVSAAREAIRQLEAALENQRDVHLGDVDCYAAGCIATMTTPTMGDYQKWQSAAPVALKRHWGGAIVLTGPETQPRSSDTSPGDGEIRTQMVLLFN